MESTTDKLPPAIKPVKLPNNLNFTTRLDIDGEWSAECFIFGAYFRGYGITPVQAVSDVLNLAVTRETEWREAGGEPR